MDNPENPNTNGVQPYQPQNRSLQNWSESGRLVEVRKLLEPAPEAQVIQELASALILVAPAGFTEGDRRAWLTAAAITLEGIPADLLLRGVAVARRESEHPSKIVPAILADIKDSWKSRRREMIERSTVPMLTAPVRDDFVPCSPEEAAAIMAEFGLRRNPLDMAKA